METEIKCKHIRPIARRMMLSFEQVFVIHRRKKGIYLSIFPLHLYCRVALVARYFSYLKANSRKHNLLSRSLNEVWPEGRKASMTRSAHALVSTTAHCSIGHKVWTVYTNNNGTNAVKQNCMWSVTTCFAVLLHKPSRNEPNQNHYNGMQTPS
jgi:hypothetical protein